MTSLIFIQIISSKVFYIPKKNRPEKALKHFFDSYQQKLDSSCLAQAVDFKEVELFLLKHVDNL